MNTASQITTYATQADLLNSQIQIQFPIREQNSQSEKSSPQIRIDLSSKEDLEGAETLPTEENQDRVRDSIQKIPLNTSNNQPNTNLIPSPFLKTFANVRSLNSQVKHLQTNQSPLGVDYVHGIRRSQLRLRQTASADEQIQVVKLNYDYVDYGYWLLIAAGICIIVRLMYPESRV